MSCNADLAVLYLSSGTISESSWHKIRVFIISSYVQRLGSG
jgi:hypothetical protein